MAATTGGSWRAWEPKYVITRIGILSCRCCARRRELLRDVLPASSSELRASWGKGTAFLAATVGRRPRACLAMSGQPLSSEFVAGWIKSDYPASRCALVLRLKRRRSIGRTAQEARVKDS